MKKDKMEERKMKEKGKGENREKKRLNEKK